MLKKLTNTISKTITVLIAVIFVFASSVPVQATLSDELAEVQRKIEELRNQKINIQNQMNIDKNTADQYSAEIFQLKGQIDILANLIQEKELVIQALNLQISILTNNIDKTTNDIATAKEIIAELEDETDQRMIDIYMSEKTFSQLDMFFNTSGTDIIKYSVYQDSFQDETNKMIGALNQKKEELLLQKAQLEKDKIQLVGDQLKLDEEKLALTKSQSQLDQQRSDFVRKRNAALQKVRNYSSLYASMTSEEKRAEEQKEAILRLIMARTEAGNGVFVKAGTFIGIEGSTGYSFGVHLHFGVMVGGNLYSDTRNPCEYLPYNVYPGNGDDNCDHKGSGAFIVPLSPAGRLTSGYKPWYRPSHLGIDITSATGGGNVLAAHDGYVYYGYENGGWGNFAKVCEVRNCSSGIRTIYAHMRCTAAVKGASGSCGN